MNLRIAPRKLVCLLALAAALPPAFAAERKPPAAKTIDSGSFGIFVNGKRVATETFTIEQTADGSVTKSELKAEAGDVKAVQTSELQLSSVGNLRRYAWNEVSPGKAQATVEPQDEQMLMQRVVLGPNEKPIDQPFLLPASTAILDDYFFIQRELLAWRYLGAGCRPTPGDMQCKLSPAEFPALIPRQHLSLRVRMAYLGPETVVVRGEPRQLNRFHLQGEGMDWALWLDENNKLIRVVIAADKTEIVRD